MKGSPPKPAAPKPAAPKPAAKSTKPAKPKKPEGNKYWKRDLTRTARGDVEGTAANAVVVLNNDPACKDLIAYDAFADRVMKLRPTRWHSFDRPRRAFRRPGAWTDLDTDLLRSWFAREHDMKIRLADALSALNIHSHRRVINGPLDYLKPLEWDGVPRLNRWLIDFAGAADKPYTRTVGGMWMISAVARAFQPGCQVDHSLVLEGDQSIGKSSLFRTLVPNKDWFLVDIGSEFGKLESLQKLKAKWIVEMSELDSLSRSSLSAAKAFLTNQVDSYRKSYGRVSEDHPRTCVFAGTTNKDEYLSDETGNRRFWPVRVVKINLKALAAARDQLWAEAVARYRAGKAWHITDPFLLAAAKTEQGRRLQTHPWERPIAEHLASKEVQKTGITTLELLAVLKVRPADQNRACESQVGNILKKLGWVEMGRKRIGKHRVRRFFIGTQSGRRMDASRTRDTNVVQIDAFRERSEKTENTPE